VHVENAQPLRAAVKRVATSPRLEGRPRRAGAPADQTRVAAERAWNVDIAGQIADPQFALARIRI
jgi:hypothetical protein